jgi:hypothetical protein
LLFLFLFRLVLASTFERFMHILKKNIDALGVARVLGFILFSQAWVLKHMHFLYHATPFAPS